MTIATKLLLCFASGLPVEAQTLDGDGVSGELVSLTATEAGVLVDGESRILPVANLHEIRLTGNSSRSDVRRRSGPEVRLIDGSQLTIDGAELAAASVTVVSERLGDFKVPQGTVRSLRFGKSDSQVESAWEQLTERETQDDLVIVRKGDALDHYGGVVSGIDSEAVKFLLDGSPVSIPKALVFGVVFANRQPASPQAMGRVDLAGGDWLQMNSVGWDGEAFRVELAAGATVRLAPGEIQRLDFSLGKIRFLSDEEPVQVSYTPLELAVAEEFPEIAADLQRYRRDKTRAGRPLQVGGKEYTRGLWLHSGTTITYRLFRDFRRFRAIMDIDQDIVSEFCDPAVGVVIRGDGQELLNTTVRRADDARELDIDVTNVRELQIEVIPTDPTGMCEHLDLAEARLIK